MRKISVAIATYNEEKNIKTCLDSVLGWVDEVVVVDGSSTDRTCKIVKKYNKVKLIVTDNPPIFHINKQKAINACTSEWILQLDADEVVTKELKSEILKAIDRQLIIGYYIPRKNYFLGKWMKKGGLYPDYVLRLFRKGKGKFPCKSVHEQIEVKGKVAYLKNELVHRPYPNLREYFYKAGKYTDLTARKLREDSVKINPFSVAKYILVLPLSSFLKIYFRHLGVLDCWRGFIWAFLSSLHYPVAFIKYWRKETFD